MNTFRACWHALALLFSPALEPELVACGGGALDVRCEPNVQVKRIHRHLEHLLVGLKEGMEGRKARDTPMCGGYEDGTVYHEDLYRCRKSAVGTTRKEVQTHSAQME